MTETKTSRQLLYLGLIGFFIFFSVKGKDLIFFFPFVLCFPRKQTGDMLGNGLRFGGARGENRFYIPVKARKNQNHQQKQGRKANSNSNKADDTDTKDPSCNSPLQNPPLEPVTNLDRFLNSTKPLVPAQFFSKVHLLSFLICSYLCAFQYL